MPISFVVFEVLCFLGLTVAVVWVVRIKVTMSRLEEQATSWPTTEATIQQAGTIVLGRDSGELPEFHFSYVVSDEYYSGSFALSVFGDLADSLRNEMIDKKVTVCYDPNQPSRYYVPDKTIGGCDVKRVPE